MTGPAPEVATVRLAVRGALADSTALPSAVSKSTVCGKSSR